VHDSYLLLTPFLTLLVVALVGFVGCDIVFGLDRVDYNPPRNLRATRGNGKITLDWDPPSEGPMASNYVLKRATSPGISDTSPGVTYNVTAPATTYEDTDVMDTVTYYYRVSNDSAPSNEIEVPPGIPGLQSLITPTTLGTLRNDFGAFVGMGITVGAAPLVVKTLGRFLVPGNNGVHLVKLVDGATKADIPGGSVNLNLAGGSAGDFVFAQLPAEITLNPGADYYIISQEMMGGDQWHDSDTQVSMTGVVTRVYAVNGDGAGNYNTAPVNGSLYGPVNLQY
jgi:hypothetical protein